MKGVKPKPAPKGYGIGGVTQVDWKIQEKCVCTGGNGGARFDGCGLTIKPQVHILPELPSFPYNVILDDEQDHTNDWREWGYCGIQNDPEIDRKENEYRGTTFKNLKDCRVQTHDWLENHLEPQARIVNAATNKRWDLTGEKHAHGAVK